MVKLVKTRRICLTEEEKEMIIYSLRECIPMLKINFILSKDAPDVLMKLKKGLSSSWKDNSEQRLKTAVQLLIRLQDGKIDELVQDYFRYVLEVKLSQLSKKLENG